MSLRLLHRAILSHLVVAVPPAVALGLLVVDVNERGLRTDAHTLHLSVVGRVRDAIEAEVKARFEVLEHGERVLSIPGLHLEDKTRLLRAQVAAGSLDWLALYRADGQRDSLVRPSAEGATAPATLPQALRHRARTDGRAVSPPDARQQVMLAVPLRVDGEILGFLAGPFSVARLAPRIEQLQEAFLGPEGRIEVVDDQARRLVGTAGAPGAQLGLHTPFEGLSGDGAGLERFSAGISTTYKDAAGARWLASLDASTELGWVVASARPESVALATIDAVKQRTLLLAAIAALAAGLVGLLFARATVNPVRALAKDVRASAKAGFSAPVDAGGSPELAALGGAFNDALARLSRYRKELQHRSQLQVRLSRQLTPSALHALLSQSTLEAESASTEPLSVLYVDLAKGHTLDGAEGSQVVEILSDLYAQACATIEQHRGRVDRFSGDAVVGVFPERLVGHPTQSAHAAAKEVLERVEALAARHPRLQVAVSVGLVSQVGQLAYPADGGELTVGGEIVEAAAALQQSAEAGRIAMDAQSRQALSEGKPAAAQEPKP